MTSPKPSSYMFLWATGGTITQDWADAASLIFDRLLSGFTGEQLIGPIDPVMVNDHGDATVYTLERFFGPGHLGGTGR